MAEVTPVPGPNESVAEMHAYAADDRQANPNASHARSEHRTLPEPASFTVTPRPTA